MTKESAGLLMYKKQNRIEIFLVHPGGPFWKNKEKGAWSIPKGEISKGENPFDRAKKEIFEETGVKPPENKEMYINLGTVKQKGGKIVHAWAFEGDFNFLVCRSYVKIVLNGKEIKFPEVDKAGFFTLEKSYELINPAQIKFIENLKEKIK